MSKKRFTVYGNCQAAALASQLLSHARFTDAYDYVPLAPCFLISEADIQAWTTRHRGELDLLVAQDLQPGWRDANPAWDVTSVASALRGDGRLLRYTDIYFRGVDPMLVYPKTFRRPPHCDYTDLISLTLAAFGFPDASWCVAIHGAPDLLDAHEIAAIRDLAEMELLRRESGLEIRSGAEVAAFARRTPAFHTFNHPSNDCLDLVSRRVLESLGTDPQPQRPIDHELLLTVRFPMPASLRDSYPEVSSMPSPTVRLEDGKDISLQVYFEASLDYLSIYSAADLQQELARQRENSLSGIVIRAIERALANRLAVAPAVLDEIGRLLLQRISPEFLLKKADPQAVGFMVDLVGTLRSTLLPRHAGEQLSVLDLGAKSGAGSQLMGLLGQDASFSKVKFRVTCADVDATYRDYALAAHPNIEYLNADVFAAGRTWDVVICSHVIEHVPDPMDFVRRLRRIARKYIVLAFPYMEDPASLIPGHLHSLGHDFLRALQPARFEIYDGLFWSQSLCAVAVIEMKDRAVE